MTVTLDVSPYLLTCRKCKIQYSGQTVDQFRSKWNNYKSYSRKQSRSGFCMQQHLFNHFCTSRYAGILDDVSITFIDKTDPSDRLKREDYWRRTLKIMAPFELNIVLNVMSPYIYLLIFPYTGSLWHICQPGPALFRT